MPSMMSGPGMLTPSSSRSSRLTRPVAFIWLMRSAWCRANTWPTCACDKVDQQQQEAQCTRHQEGLEWVRPPFEGLADSLLQLGGVQGV
jgi:hypothetical protein